MLTVFVTLQIRAEKITEFIEGILANAEATRSEPGCLHFDVNRSTEEPLLFHLYEIYRDDDAFFVAHRHAAHYSAWRNVLSECVVPGSHINVFARPVTGSGLQALESEDLNGL